MEYRKRLTIRDKEIVNDYLNNQMEIEHIRKKYNFKSRRSVYNALDRYERKTKTNIPRHRRDDPLVNKRRREGFGLQESEIKRAVAGVAER